MYNITIKCLNCAVVRLVCKRMGVARGGELIIMLRGRMILTIDDDDDDDKPCVGPI